MFDKIKELLLGVAPTLSTALGGPGAGLATKTIVNALGFSSDISSDELLSSLQSMTQEQQLALKQADYQFRIDQMQQKNISMQQSYANESNARAMQNDWVNKARIELIRMFFILSVLIYGATFVLYARQDVGGNEGYVLGSINAFISAAWLLIIGFYFGDAAGKVKQWFTKNTQ